MMQCIVDRFEGDYAVIKYCGKVLNFPRVFLPAGAREGDVLNVIVKIDGNETDRLKAEIKKLMDDVWEK